MSLGHCNLKQQCEFKLFRIAKIQNTDNTRFWGGCGTPGTH